MSLFLAAAAFLAAASVFAANDTDDAAGGESTNSDLGQQSDGSCHLKATVGSKSDESIGPIDLPSGTSSDAKTSAQGG